ncbi:macrolide transport system ATP-binding/permease protein [Metabacillus crassostreae]|uniref:ribosomal protection-like ABC-F family protein n=1 Tax=Metabacillus crassostreae TaxID=929098 RepID=UPI00195E5F67|nr:ABC-F type ribosomal protection protein [Metabacillus crassostreae]MBM7602398.1 macrolide transport system ATP-binding/permease protein [Metabacillus crassostreae]
MLLLAANKIEKSYGDRCIIKVDSLKVYNGERIGIVGKNGEGKSTLLKILVNELEPDHGTVQIYCPIAYIPQLDASDINEISSELVSQWRIPNEKNCVLSGGEETRKKIAAAVSSNAKLIIADEPTSHLDVQGVEKFEKETKEFNGAVVIISHDRELLNTICTSIWEVDSGGIHCFEGNYHDYIEQNQQLKNRQWIEYENYTKEKQRLEQAALEKSKKSKSLKKAPSRMGNSEARLHKRSVGQKKAKLDKGVRAIQSRIEQLEIKTKPKTEEKIVFDRTHFNQLHSKTAISFDRVTATLGNKMLFLDFSGSIKPGEKVAVIGKNGVGKSTLLNMIVSGHEGISIAKPVAIGYFHQQLENLDEHKSILENVKEASQYTEQFIRTVLSRLQFKREDVHKKVAMLSGGERVKTALIKVLLGNYNVLLLDEPTNYLDIHTKEALQMVLNDYPGTIIFVSHDRYFVKAMASHIISIENKMASFREIDNSNDASEIEMKHEREVNLIAVDMDLTEIISKLSITSNIVEKNLLEEKYLELLRIKNELSKKK